MSTDSSGNPTHEPGPFPGNPTRERGPELERALVELLIRAENEGQSAVSTVCHQFPSFHTELREFWELHRQFEAAAVHSGSPIETPTVSSFMGTSEVAEGRRIGPYELIEEIDRGGMGVVFRARHLKLDRIVALKVIRSGELARAEEIARFRSEAEAAAHLSHPGIVPIYEVGQEGGLIYFTMAFIDGRTLTEWSAKTAISPDDAARLVYRICQAVEFAHQHGIYHRDLKPGNVLVDKNGQPIVIDFGLAKFAQRDNELTNTGQILGTPAYMAPEQASGRGRHAEATADIYSIGAVLYFLLSGQAPFSGPTPFDVLLQVIDREPPPPSKLNRRVSRELDYVCRRAMEKRPENRYGSAAEMARDLERLLKREPLKLPLQSWRDYISVWWRREPILVCHVCGIGTTVLIVCVSSPYYLAAWTISEQLGLLVLWFIACFALQYWVYRARWRDAACLTWATVDVFLFTWLVSNADPPRTLLLIGYPMLIAASSLFYRTRFVIFMTTLCVLGFIWLKFVEVDGSLARIDFCAIFVSGLLVIGLTMHSMIRRVRGMSVFHEGNA